MSSITVKYTQLRLCIAMQIFRTQITLQNVASEISKCDIMFFLPKL